MKHERIQLHSDVGRAMLLFWSYARWWMPLATAWTVGLGYFLFSSRRIPVVPVLFCLPFFPLSRWASLNATTVFATPSGLEMPGRRRTVAWSSVKEVREIPFVGGLLLNVYRVTFDDGTAPLTFYGVHELECVVRRFQHSSTRVEPGESAA